jgi:hypothetical protein
MCHKVIMRKSLLTLVAVGSLSLFACASNRADDVGSNEQHATVDIDHMFKRPDGRYDVTCADGTQSTLTAEQINQNMACGGPHGSSSDGGVVTDDDDDDNNNNTAATCLSKDPIDATQYEYVKANTAQRACTARELADFSAYYRAHATDNDLTTGWAASVSPGCAACIFTDVTNGPATTWGPVLIKDGQLQDVNRGGCIEIVSGSEACGRAYQQFQDCSVDACLKNCTTQAEFTKCRQDATVLTTSCKNALDSVKTACDESKIGQYETACKGTTYTFEGPIKRACVGTP